MSRRRRSEPKRNQTKKAMKGTAAAPAVTDEFISSLRGCCKGEGSMADALHEDRQEKSFAERRREHQMETFATREFLFVNDITEKASDKS